MNISQEGQDLNVTARDKPQTLEEKSRHGAPTLLVLGEKKEKGKKRKGRKGKKPAFVLLFEFETIPENRAEPSWVHIKKEQNGTGIHLYKKIGK